MHDCTPSEIRLVISSSPPTSGSQTPPGTTESVPPESPRILTDARRFSFVALPNALIWQRVFAELPHEAVRVLWLLCRSAGFTGVCDRKWRSEARALGLSARRLSRMVDALCAANLISRDGHRLTVQLTAGVPTQPAPVAGLDILYSDAPVTKWNTGDLTLDVVTKLTGSQLKVLTVMQSLTRGSNRCAVKMETLLWLTGISDPSFRQARARLALLNLIVIHTNSPHPTEYEVHA